MGWRITSMASNQCNGNLFDVWACIQSILSQWRNVTKPKSWSFNGKLVSTSYLIMTALFDSQEKLLVNNNGHLIKCITYISTTVCNQKHTVSYIIQTLTAIKALKLTFIYRSSAYIAGHGWGLFRMWGTNKALLCGWYIFMCSVDH